MGPTTRQGPHHSAQKSTSTGLSELSTSSWKFAVVNSKAMGVTILVGQRYEGFISAVQDKVRFTDGFQI
jgi:hypothetical protein